RNRRKYGVAVLRLSMSIEVGKLLGGEIKLESTPGQGSTFILYLPDRYVPVRTKALKEAASMATEEEAHAASKPAGVGEAILELITTDVQDDRENLKPGDQTLLIVAEELSFGSMLLYL